MRRRLCRGTSQAHEFRPQLNRKVYCPPCFQNKPGPFLLEFLSCPESFAPLLDPFFPVPLSP